MSALHPTTPRGGRAVLATTLCALATLTSLHALTNLLGTTPWRGAVAVQVLVTAVVVALVRAVTRSAWLPTVVGLVVATGAVLLRYGAPPGRLQLVPDHASWDRTVATWHEGVHLVQVAAVPVDVVRPLELLLAVGALLVLLAADLLAVGLGMPALAGIAFAAMWTPTIVLEFPARGSALFWTGMLYLGLLALSAAPRTSRVGTRRRTTLATASSVAIMCAALVAGPVLAALPGWSSWALPRFGSGPSGPVDLSSDLDVRSSLGGRTDRVVLRYQVRSPDAPADPAEPTDGTVPTDPATDPGGTPSAEPTSGTRAVNANTVGPLRSLTLLSFDGRSWHADSDSGASVPLGTVQGLLAPDAARLGAAPDPGRGTVAVVDAVVGALADRQLPISTFPRTLAIDGEWQYDPVRDQVDGAQETVEGQTFSMVVEVPQLTPDDLRDAVVGDPGDPRALEVPQTSHAADIHDLALEVTKDSAGPYGQALALQSYLRSTANFTYDTRIPPARTDDPVWDFLESRQGYCVQFATAMTVMARSLGIPARVGVGFLPGRSDDGTYVVTGRESHAWPELYFAGHGWLRFEPTPAVQTGAPPPWSDPLYNTAAPTTPTEAPLPTAQPRPDTTAPSAVPPGTATDVERTAWWPAVLTVSVVLVLAALVVVLVVRRRARVLADLTPEQAWSRLRRSLARLGVRWSAAATPRSVVGQVNAQVASLTGRELDDDAATALVALAHAVEQARYAPRAQAPGPGAAAGWADAVTDGVRAAGLDRTGPLARVARLRRRSHGVTAPRSADRTG